jgi:prepilin-type N-terminal cleavage/methylation domain-containing protein
MTFHTSYSHTFLSLRKGFTLIELLVVVAIISVLATIVLSSLGDAREKAKEVRALSEMKAIYTAFNFYLLDNKGVGPGTGVLQWREPDCVGNLNVTNTGNDYPNGVLLSSYASQMDAYRDTAQLNPWGYQYEIDAAYNCIRSKSAKGCNGKRWVYALVANKTSEGTNNYSPSDVVYSLCQHAD